MARRIPTIEEILGYDGSIVYFVPHKVDEQKMGLLAVTHLDLDNIEGGVVPVAEAGVRPAWLNEVRRRHWEGLLDTAHRLKARRFLKVGFTSKTWERRSSGRGRSTTFEIRGVPVVEDKSVSPVFVPGSLAFERDIHARLDDYRVDPKREFFWLDGCPELEELFGVSLPPS